MSMYDVLAATAWLRARLLAPPAAEARALPTEAMDMEGCRAELERIDAHRAVLDRSSAALNTRIQELMPFASVAGEALPASPGALDVVGCQRAVRGNAWLMALDTIRAAAVRKRMAELEPAVDHGEIEAVEARLAATRDTLASKLEGLVAVLAAMPPGLPVGAAAGEAMAELEGLGKSVREDTEALERLRARLAAAVPEPVNPALAEYGTSLREAYERMGAEERRRVCEQEERLGRVGGDSALPVRFRVLAIGCLSDATKANALARAQGGDGKGARWLDQLLNIPFDKVRELPVGLASTPDARARFLREARARMDLEVYGHEYAKDQILRFLAKMSSGSGGRGEVLGIQGPMGCGKTTLVKRCIAAALGVPLVVIALGGMMDVTSLTGHVFTYSGSTHGRLVGALMEAGCMNPVILLDEVDKVCDTPKGHAVINALIHLTDPATNSGFADEYFDGVPIDFGKAFIVFTYNDEAAVSPVLLDRMTRIRTGGYSAADKREIAARHMLPQLCRDYGFAESEVRLAEGAVDEVVQRVDTEQGVRNLQRGLRDVVAGLNLKRCLDGAQACGDMVVGTETIAEFVRREPAAAASCSAEMMYL